MNSFVWVLLIHLSSVQEGGITKLGPWEYEQSCLLAKSAVKERMPKKHKSWTNFYCVKIPTPLGVTLSDSSDVTAP